MAPIVHGLEAQYGDRIDFLYLDIADTANQPAMAALGFDRTPHFILLTPAGQPVRAWSGSLVPRDTLEAALRAL